MIARAEGLTASTETQRKLSVRDESLQHPLTSSTSPMRVHGSCHCDAIQFEALVDPQRVTICHCTDCQSLTGTAYRVTVAAGAGDFRLVRGTPKVYFKVGDSGNRRAQVFCGECGSHLYAHAAVESPVSYGLRVGSLRERAALIPNKRIWCRSALPWSTDLSDMAGSERE